MSNRSGRSWYRLSSIVRPTPSSSRDPSPPPPPSPPPQPLPPPSPISPSKEIEAANPSLAPLSLSTKHDPPKTGHKHETAHPKNILTPPHSSRDPSSPRHVINPPPSPPPQPLPPPSPRSPPKEFEEANPSLVPLSLSSKHDQPKSEHKHETTRSSHNPSPPRHVISPPPSPPPQQLFSPLPPRLPKSPPKEIEEATRSPVPLSRSTKHNPAKPGHGPSEKTDLVNTQGLITNSPSEKGNLVQGPNNDQQKDFNISSNEFNDTIVNTEGFITIISGENKGAVMKIIQSSSKTHRRSDDEGNESKSKSKKHSNNGENLPMDGVVNSNVQMINSSVVYSSTGTHYDPGVHLSLYRKPSSGNGFIAKDHGNGYTSSIN